MSDFFGQSDRDMGQGEIRESIMEVSLNIDNLYGHVLEMDAYPKNDRVVPAGTTAYPYSPIFTGDGRVLSWGQAPPAGSTTGDILYWDSTLNDSKGAWAKLGIGDADDVLIVNSGKPSWEDVLGEKIPAGTVDSQMLRWNHSLGEWVTIASPGTPDTGQNYVLKNNDSDTIVWELESPPNGTVTNQMLIWNNSTDLWEMITAPSTDKDVLTYETVAGVTWSAPTGGLPTGSSGGLLYWDDRLSPSAWAVLLKGSADNVLYMDSSGGYPEWKA